VAVTIDVDTRALAGLIVDVRAGMQAGAEKAGQVASDRVRLTFEAEGNRDGMDAWEPTTAIALRNRRNPPTEGSSDWKTLTDTGALKASVSGEIVNNAPDLVEIEVAHRTPYGDVLDQGGPTTIDGQSYVLPPRPFLDLADPVDVDLLELAVDDALAGVL
jgi:phage gpG-like protein